PSASPRSISLSHPLLTAPIGRSLFRLAGPTTGLMLVQILVAVADAYFVGRLGTDALAGIALVVPFVTMTANIANGAMGGAVAASFAPALGAGRSDDANAIVAHALVLAAALGLVCATADWLAASWLFGWLGGSEAVREQALAFSHIWFTGAIAIWTGSFLAALLRGSGDSATPSSSGLVLSIAYVPFTAVFTLGVGDWPGLGLAGMAIASLTGATAWALVLARAVWRGRLGLVPKLTNTRLQWKIFRDIL